MEVRPDLEIAFDEPTAALDSRVSLSGPGFAAEHIRLDAPTACSYRWQGDHHYLALHDIELADGEVCIDGLPPRRERDLRDTITLVPRGATVSGWAQPLKRSNAVTAIYFDPEQLSEMIGRRYRETELRPMLYVRDPALQATLLKLRQLLTQPRPDVLYAETLCLVAAIEFTRCLGDMPTGQLAPQQVRDVLDYINAHLKDDISLAVLAGVARLSRFHFARAFKATTGASPYHYVLSRRVDTARDLLRNSETPVEVIAASVGFGSGAQLGRAFRKLVGETPQAFRRRFR